MSTVRERAAEIYEHLVSHNAHGYSQPNRAGIGTGGKIGETITLSDGTTIGIAAGDRDCSSSVIEAYAAQGVDVGGATYTGNMVKCMTSTGNFEALPGNRWREAERGDILVNEARHTVMCLGNGKVGTFSSSETGGISGTSGDQTGKESYITNLYAPSDGWDYMLRYTGEDNNMTNEQAEQLKFIYDHLHWNDETHFSDLGNLVAQMPITYGNGEAKTTATLGDRLAYIDAHTHHVDALLQKIIDMLAENAES